MLQTRTEDGSKRNAATGKIRGGTELHSVTQSQGTKAEFIP
jgi:hypothetical protein